MDRRQEALNLAEETLEILETGSGSLTPIVLRALRLARLIDHQAVILWMRLELRGYGSNGPGQGLNWVTQADWSGRRVANSDPAKFWVTPIEQVESLLAVARDRLRASQPPMTTVSETGAPAPAWGTQTVTEKLLNQYRSDRSSAEAEIAKWAAIVATLRGSLQEWLSDLVTTLKYGEVVEDVFSRAKTRFDALLTSSAPDVASALAAAYSRSASAEPEEWAQSLASCRRAIKALADALYPPAPPKDGHELTDAAYKNRLIQFVKERIASGSQRGVLLADIDALIARLDALNDLVSKGVHGVTQSEEVDIAVIQTYVLAGELLSLSGAEAGQAVKTSPPGEMEAEQRSVPETERRGRGTKSPGKGSQRASRKPVAPEDQSPASV